MEIGEKIKSLRKEKGLSQTQLSKDSGVSLPYLNLIEKNKADAVSDDILSQIAKVLSVSLNELKDSVKGLKVGFNPSIWSIPILNMIINKPGIKARVAYTYRSAEKDNLYFDLNDSENPNLYNVDGDLLRKTLEKHNENEVKILSEKELSNELIIQEHDLVFLPYSNKDTGLTSIASICSTVKGGIYVVVFSNNPNEKDWTYKDELSLLAKREKIKLDLIKDGWNTLIKNSAFHYQEESISDFVISEIVEGDLAIPGKKRFEIQNSTISDTVSYMENRWEISSAVQSAISHDTNGGSINEQVLRKMLNNRSQHNLIEMEDDQDDYNIYIGWEPYVSRLVKLYQEKYKGNFCVTFDINEFLDKTNSLFYLDYECFIKSDRMDSIKKNEDVKQFFIELDNTIKRLEKLSKSKSMSPEIDVIAKILQIDSDRVFELIKQIKFSLKFYPNWSL